MTQPWTDEDVELVAETVAANLGLEAWQVRTAARIALRAVEDAADIRAARAALAEPGASVPLAQVLADYDDDLAAYSDEHGNRTDDCGACTLVPSVSGWARMTQARCPVHGSLPDTEEDTDR